MIWNESVGYKAKIIIICQLSKTLSICQLSTIPSRFYGYLSEPKSIQSTSISRLRNAMTGSRCMTARSTDSLIVYRKSRHLPHSLPSSSSGWIKILAQTFKVNPFSLMAPLKFWPALRVGLANWPFLFAEIRSTRAGIGLPRSFGSERQPRPTRTGSEPLFYELMTALLRRRNAPRRQRLQKCHSENDHFPLVEHSFGLRSSGSR